MPEHLPSFIWKYGFMRGRGLSRSMNRMRRYRSPLNRLSDLMPEATNLSKLCMKGQSFMPDPLGQSSGRQVFLTVRSRDLNFVFPRLSGSARQTAWSKKWWHMRPVYWKCSSWGVTFANSWLLKVSFLWFVVVEDHIPYMGFRMNIPPKHRYLDFVGVIALNQEVDVADGAGNQRQTSGDCCNSD